MKATFLKAAVPLTKTFKIRDGQLEKIGHPRILDYTSFEVQYTTLEELCEALKEHANQGHCFLKGNLNRPLINEPRAGSTDPNAPTQLTLLDLDGLRSLSSVDEFMESTGMGAVDYVVQYSSSMGVIPERGISAHLFVMLSRDYSPAILKQWLIHLNLTNQALVSNLSLTRTNNAIRWPLDITTCQNDKLIYIAPPIIGEGVVDRFEGDRIKLVKKQHRTFTLPEDIPSAEANKRATEAALNKLRSAAGLAERPKNTYKVDGNIEYLAKPDKAVVSGVKMDRGFVYLNINGGDSWGYYHPENNPEYIFNFKNEPNYKTSELLPEYWSEVKSKMADPVYDKEGILWLAFRDFQSAVYYNGFYDKKKNELCLSQARSADQLRHFLKQHGQPVGDFIPDWDLVFEPGNDTIVNIEKRRINMFQPSKFMRKKPKHVTVMPPTIRKVMLNMLGNSEECLDHMANWLAVIIQYRCMTQTCWVAHGIEGTGKGLFVNKILRPIFGHSYVVTKRMRELDSTFNGYMEYALILAIDEVELTAMKNSNVINADLKNYITEPVISIRNMHQGARQAPNFVNILMQSNMSHVTFISETDRRFNVAPYQPEKLIITDEELETLDSELEDFYGYLMTYKASKQRARTPLNNEARKEMQQLSRSAIDEVSLAFKNGNIEFFENMLPNVATSLLPVDQQSAADAYVSLIQRIKKGQDTLVREELYTLLDYAVGNVPRAPHKLATYLKHHKIVIEPIKVDGKTQRGIRVNWKREAKSTVLPDKE